MLRHTIIPLLALAGATAAQARTPDPSLARQEGVLQWVDTRIGTSGHGHTFMGAAAPFGAVQARSQQLQQRLGLVFGLPRFGFDLRRIRTPAPQRHGMQRHGRPALHAYRGRNTCDARIAGESRQRLRLALLAPARSDRPGLLPAASGRLRHRRRTDRHRARGTAPLHLPRRGAETGGDKSLRRQRRRPRDGDLHRTAGQPYGPRLPLFVGLVQTTAHLFHGTLLGTRDARNLQRRQTRRRQQHRARHKPQGSRTARRFGPRGTGQSRHLARQHGGRGAQYRL